MFKNVRDPISVDHLERDAEAQFELAPTFEEGPDAAFQFGFSDEMDQMFWS
jgi:hypothetical protein